MFLMLAAVSWFDCIGCRNAGDERPDTELSWS